jgi:hypothetical protein
MYIYIYIWSIILYIIYLGIMNEERIFYFSLCEEPEESINRIKKGSAIKRKMKLGKMYTLHIHTKKQGYICKTRGE